MIYWVNIPEVGLVKSPVMIDRSSECLFVFNDDIVQFVQSALKLFFWGGI